MMMVVMVTAATAAFAMFVIMVSAAAATFTMFVMVMTAAAAMPSLRYFNRFKRHNGFFEFEPCFGKKLLQFFILGNRKTVFNLGNSNAAI